MQHLDFVFLSVHSVKHGITYFYWITIEMIQPFHPWPFKVFKHNKTFFFAMLGNTTIVVINKGASCPRLIAMKAKKAIFQRNRDGIL